mgnify:FL=1
MRSIYLSIVLFVCTVFTAAAQQDVQFSDYKLNISSFNPAFAGYFDGSAMLIYRTQFVGVEGAPKSQNFNLNIPVNREMGLAFNVINETLGVTDETTITGDYSYSINIDDVNTFSMGLKAGFNVLNVDYSRLIIDDNTDPSFMNNIDNKVSPRIGVGFLFNTPDWFIGVSTPNFIEENYNPTVSGSTATSKPHIYGMTGYQTALTDQLIFKPSILARGVSGAPVAIDFALNFDFMEKFRFGASYRWDSAVTAIVGVDFLQTMQAGYAYDHNINDLGKYAPSSHQFYLKYTFKKSSDMKRKCSCSFSDSSSNLEF